MRYLCAYNAVVCTVIALFAWSVESVLVLRMAVSVLSFYIAASEVISILRIETERKERAWERS